MLGCGVGSGAEQIATLDCLFPLLTNVIYWLILFSGTVALVMLIVSGIRFITSGGDAKTVEAAKKAITYAILGLLIVFLSFFILNTIAYVTNVACIRNSANGTVSLTNPFQSCGSGGVSESANRCAAGSSCESACASSETTVAGSCFTRDGFVGVCCEPRRGGR